MNRKNKRDFLIYGKALIAVTRNMKKRKFTKTLNNNQSSNNNNSLLNPIKNNNKNLSKPK